MRFNDSDVGNLNVYSESNEIKDLSKKKIDDLPELLNIKARKYSYSDHIPRPVFSGGFKKKYNTKTKKVDITQKSLMCTDLDIKQGRCSPLKYYKPNNLSSGGPKKTLELIKIGDILFDKVDAKNLPYGLEYVGVGIAMLINYITESSSDALKKLGMPGIEWINIEYETAYYPNGFDEIVSNFESAAIQPIKNLVAGGGYCSGGECEPLGTNYVIPMGKGNATKVNIGSSVIYNITNKKYDTFTVVKNVTKDISNINLNNITTKKTSIENYKRVIPSKNTEAIMSIGIQTIKGQAIVIKKAGAIPNINIDRFIFKPTIIGAPIVTNFIYKYNDNISEDDKITILNQPTSCTYTCKIKASVTFTLELDTPVSDNKLYWTYKNINYKYYYLNGKWKKIKYSIGQTYRPEDGTNFLKENKINCIFPLHYEYIKKMGVLKKEALNSLNFTFDDKNPQKSQFCLKLKDRDINKELKGEWRVAIIEGMASGNSKNDATKKNATKKNATNINVSKINVSKNDVIFDPRDISELVRYYNDACKTTSLTQTVYKIKVYKNITRDDLKFLFKAKDTVYIYNKDKDKKENIKTTVFYININILNDDYYIDTNRTTEYIGNITGTKKVYIKQQNGKFKKILPKSEVGDITFDKSIHKYLIKTKKENLKVNEKLNQRYIEVNNIPDNAVIEKLGIRGIIPGIIVDVFQTISLPLFYLGFTSSWTDKEITIGEYKHKNPSNRKIFIQYCLEKEWLLNNINNKNNKNNVYKTLALLWLDTNRYDKTYPKDKTTAIGRLKRITLTDSFLTECKKISGVSDFPVTETLSIFYYGKCMELADSVKIADKNFNKKLSDSLKVHSNEDFIKRVDVAFAAAIRSKFPNKALLYTVIQEKFGLSDSEDAKVIIAKYKKITTSTKTKLSYILYPYKDIFTNFKVNTTTYVNYLHKFKTDYISSYKIKGQTKEIIEQFTFDENNNIVLFLLCFLVIILIYTYIK